MAKSPAATAWRAAKSAAEFLANVGDLDYNQIEVGKKRLKVCLTLHDEDCVKVSEGLALQAANGIQLDSATASMQLIDSIGNEEIKCTAEYLSNKCNYMAFAVVGDIGQVPHEKELLCS